MLINKKTGNIASIDLYQKNIDIVPVEWHEANKRILHKKSRSGKEIIIKFLNEPQLLTEGDILWQDETTAIVVEIQPCEAIVIRPTSMQQMAAVCYEIGNKHLPLFYFDEEILVPYEEPLFKLLFAVGYEPKRETRKLINQLKSTVSPHGAYTENKQSLFSKILQLTTSPADV